METTLKKEKPDITYGPKKARISFGLCPIRHVLAIISALVIALYYLTRDDQGLMAKINEGFIRPYHIFMGRLCSLTDFSVAELIYALVILALLFYIIRAVVLVIKRPGKLKRLYLTVITLATAAVAVYAGFCLLWGVLYYSGSFAEKTGMEVPGISTEELEAVTAYFAGLANGYSADMPRDDTGLTSFDMDGIFDKSETLYDDIMKDFPVLAGPDFRPKPMVFLLYHELYQL
jgi:hypothetical protein